MKAVPLKALALVIERGAASWGVDCFGRPLIMTRSGKIYFYSYREHRHWLNGPFEARQSQEK